MFSSTNSLFDIQSLDILEYISVGNDYINNNNNNNSNNYTNNNNNVGLLTGNLRINNNSNINNLRIAKKIKIKALLAVIRVIFIFIFYKIDSNNLTVFLMNLYSFLLTHETLVLINFLIVFVTLFFNNIFNYRNNAFRVSKFSYFIDILANFIYFSWFIFGNVCILTDKDGVQNSLTSML